MVAFRKLFPVLAVFALLMGATSAFAQVSASSPLTCNVNAGVPPVVRAEGYTELVGDIVITCTGGNAFAPFLANVQLFLNTNITSRIVGDYSEALLMIDDPGSTTPGGATVPFCPSTAVGVNPAPAVTTNGGGLVTSNIPGLPVVAGGAGAPACNAGSIAGSSQFQQGTFNVFRAQRVADVGTGGSRENALVWAGIPFIPPGTVASQRTIRITNVRANANGLGASQTLIPTQIVAFVSVFPPNTLPLNNPQQTVGYVQPGMVFAVRNCENGDPEIDLSQCVSTGSSRDFFSDPLRTGTLPAAGTFRFREGFQTAFKQQVAPGQIGAAPGAVFNSESGFVRTSDAVLGGSLVAGLADSGTRLAVRFNNIPANLRIFVSTTDVPGLGANSRATADPAKAVFVTTDANGASNLGAPAVRTPTAPFSQANLECDDSDQATTQLIEVPIVNGVGLAVWEVVSSNPNANEDLLFYFGFGHRSASGSTQVGLGTGTVAGNLAPFYAAGSAERMGGNLLPVPRFALRTDTTNAVRILPCRTNLLFPYVTNWAGFDTGISIANTSDDRGSVGSATEAGRIQSGVCRLNYYGRLANGNAPTRTQDLTDREVAAGETITMVLSTGGGLGLQGNANFQGYIIAQCDFQFAHGFAFITDGPIGQARVAEGYLALVLDGGDSNTRRGGVGATGEVRGH